MKEELVLSTCLMAGKIMMENGSEVYRVEDTMNRIAENAGISNTVSYVTATGLFMSIRNSSFSQLEEVHERSINLEKIVAVNHLSREFAAKKITLNELNARLKRVNCDTPSFSLLWQVLAAGFVSCTLMYIFGGTWQDFIPTFFIGCLGFIAGIYVKKWLQMRFLDMFVAAFVIGALAISCVKLGLASNVDHIIIGAVMTLVPGVAITNSFRDILSGDLLSGIARGIEALFIAAAIGVGIATTLLLFGGGIA